MKHKCTLKEVTNKDYEYYRYKHKRREHLEPKQLMMVDVGEQVANDDFTKGWIAARKMSNLEYVRYVCGKSVLIQVIVMCTHTCLE